MVFDLSSPCHWTNIAFFTISTPTLLNAFSLHPLLFLDTSCPSDDLHQAFFCFTYNFLFLLFGFDSDIVILDLSFKFLDEISLFMEVEGYWFLGVLSNLLVHFKVMVEAELELTLKFFFVDVGMVHNCCLVIEFRHYLKFFVFYFVDELLPNSLF